VRVKTQTELLMIDLKDSLEVYVH